METARYMVAGGQRIRATYFAEPRWEFCKGDVGVIRKELKWVEQNQYDMEENRFGDFAEPNVPVQEFITVLLLSCSYKYDGYYISTIITYFVKNTKDSGCIMPVKMAEKVKKEFIFLSHGYTRTSAVNVIPIRLVAEICFK
ncbi:19322_t:CDS:2 [Gigaspora margarita]|uniref:19322_t:CDS:1 n=1 Tax=Gigaspora margarita TaxID=4874 RepID=A0ABM8W5D6_GIGMA|nr:19322_t:CDS:2 [Gigaspora margarita]